MYYRHTAVYTPWLNIPITKQLSHICKLRSAMEEVKKFMLPWLPCLWNT